jgi:spore coat polysaccharide biosynthesis predicted glycosyltransferase SpsG
MSEILEDAKAAWVFRGSMSQRIGVGHASRLRSLALECSRQGYSCVVLLDDPDDLASAMDWTGIDLRVLRANRSWWDEAHNCGDVLITDLPGLDNESAIEARSVGFHHLVHLCIDGADHYPADLLCNSAPGLLPIPVICGRVERDLRFAVVRPEVVTARPAIPRRRREFNSGLVAMGGSDPSGRSLDAARFLDSLGIEPTILVGPGVAAPEQNLWSQSRFETKQSSDIREYVAAINDYDLVVTQGGLTSLEAMCLGTPVLCLDSQPLGWFGRNLAEAGLLTLINLESPPTDHRLEPGHLAGVSFHAFDVIDGAGATRVIEAIAQTTGRL